MSKDKDIKEVKKKKEFVYTPFIKRFKNEGQAVTGTKNAYKVEDKALTKTIEEQYTERARQKNLNPEENPNAQKNANTKKNPLKINTGRAFATDILSNTPSDQWKDVLYSAARDIGWKGRSNNPIIDALASYIMDKGVMSPSQVGAAILEGQKNSGDFTYSPPPKKNNESLTRPLAQSNAREMTDKARANLKNQGVGSGQQILRNFTTKLTNQPFLATKDTPLQTAYNIDRANEVTTKTVAMPTEQEINETGAKLAEMYEKIERDSKTASEITNQQLDTRDISMEKIPENISGQKLEEMLNEVNSESPSSAPGATEQNNNTPTPVSTKTNNSDKLDAFENFDTASLTLPGDDINSVLANPNNQNQPFKIPTDENENNPQQQQSETVLTLEQTAEKMLQDKSIGEQADILKQAQGNKELKVALEQQMISSEKFKQEDITAIEKGTFNSKESQEFNKETVKKEELSEERNIHKNLNKSNIEPEKQSEEITPKTGRLTEEEKARAKAEKVLGITPKVMEVKDKEQEKRNTKKAREVLGTIDEFKIESPKKTVKERIKEAFSKKPYKSSEEKELEKNNKKIEKIERKITKLEDAKLGSKKTSSEKKVQLYNNREEVISKLRTQIEGLKSANEIIEKQVNLQKEDKNLQKKAKEEVENTNSLIAESKEQVKTLDKKAKDFEGKIDAKNLEQGKKAILDINSGQKTIEQNDKSIEKAREKIKQIEEDKNKPTKVNDKQKELLNEARDKNIERLQKQIETLDLSNKTITKYIKQQEINTQSGEIAKPKLPPKPTLSPNAIAAKSAEINNSIVDSPTKQNISEDDFSPEDLSTLINELNSPRSSKLSTVETAEKKPTLQDATKAAEDRIMSQQIDAAEATKEPTTPKQDNIEQKLADILKDVVTVSDLDNQNPGNQNQALADILKEVPTETKPDNLEQELTKLKEKIDAESPETYSRVELLDPKTTESEINTKANSQIEQPKTEGQTTNINNQPQNTISAEEMARSEEIKAIEAELKKRGYDSQGNLEQQLAKAQASEESLKKPTETQKHMAEDVASFDDQITEAMRQEILEKQQKLLQDKIAEKSPEVANLKPDEFRKYLTEPEGVKISAEIFKNKEFQNALNTLEIEGYKKVHTIFEKNLKNIEWKEGPDQTKSTEIKNDKGEIVADIKETTVKTSQVITLENGQEKTIESYRTIDFPKELETGKGPLHLSMAAKDEKGNNVPEKDAVYFSAHYNKEGKLTEVTSPTPVKFMGEGKDAVGYIERDGKILTLPVTQGKYQEMMKEVAVNKGIGIDTSQKIEKLSQDKFTSQERTGKEAERKNPPEVTALDQGAMGNDIKTKIDQIASNLETKTPPQMPPKPKIPLMRRPLKKPTNDLDNFKSTKDPKENLKQMDQILAGKKPEEVQYMLVDQIGKGRKEVVESIVEATKPSRTDKPKDVPGLTDKDFKIAYHNGMKAAEDAKDKGTQDKMHRSSAALITEGKIQPQVHPKLVKEHTQKLNQKLDKGMSVGSH